MHVAVPFGMIVPLMIVILVLSMAMFIGMIVAVLLMAVVVPLMHMRLECPTFADRQQCDAGGFGELDHLGIGGQRFEGVCQEKLHAMPGPEDDIGAFESRGIGWTERIGVRGGGAFDDEGRRADVAHDGGDERVNGLGGCHHIGGGQGRAG